MLRLRWSLLLLTLLPARAEEVPPEVRFIGNARQLGRIAESLGNIFGRFAHGASQ